MNQAGQNNIQSALLNLRYDNKALAVRSNLLIEAIFYSDILPALETAIINKIPSAALLELSTLEIDIGIIDEHKLKDQLPKRIGIAIHKALHESTKITNGVSNFNGLEGDRFLLEALEFYLLQGHFPIWIDPSDTMEHIIHKLISDHKNDLIQILQKLVENDTVIKRIAYGLDTKLFKSLIKAIQPTNTQWINTIELALLNIARTEITTLSSSKEFIKNISFFTLKNVLNTKSLAFNRTLFLNNMLNEIAGLLNLEYEVLLQRVKSSTYANNNVLTASLEELTSSEKSISKFPASGDFQIMQLVKLLNSSIFKNDSSSDNLLKKQLLKVLKDKNKSQVLYNSLNEIGSIHVLKLCFPKKANRYLKILSSFTKLVSKGENKTTLKHYVNTTLLYLNQSTAKELDTEEYIYFLINVGKIDLLKTTSSYDLKRFIEEQADPMKFNALLNNEQKRVGISNRWKSLSKSLNKVSTRAPRNQFQPDSTEDYFLIYSRKIVGQYLKNGRLEEPNFDLTQKDVLELFQNLLKRKDSYLINLLRQHVSTNWMIDRIDALSMSNSSKKSAVVLSPATFLNGNKKTKSYLIQLYTYSPKQPIADEFKRLYKQIMWRIVVQSFLEKRPYTTATFNVAFRQSLHKVFKEKNALGVLETMIAKMKASGSIAHKEFGDSWVQSMHLSDNSKILEKTFERLPKKEPSKTNRLSTYYNFSFLP